MDDPEFVHMLKPSQGEHRGVAATDEDDFEFNEFRRHPFQLIRLGGEDAVGGRDSFERTAAKLLNAIRSNVISASPHHQGVLSSPAAAAPRARENPTFGT